MTETSLTSVLGHSVKGRPIEACWFHVTPEDAQTTLDTLFIGAFHGDEGISTQVLEGLIAWLNDSRLATLPERPFAIIPALNADGLEMNDRVNANRVDLNRNYPTQDWIVENEGTIYYSGKAPASEPETRLLMDFIERWQPKKIISLHAPYKVINFDGPARALADAMAVHSKYPVVESIGYPTRGSFGTYYGIERNIPIITLELPEDEPYEQVFKDNLQSLIAALTFV